MEKIISRSSFLILLETFKKLREHRSVAEETAD